MTAFTLDRRKALFGAAGLAAAMTPSLALAARDTGRGGFSRSRLAALTAALNAQIEAGGAVGLVTMLYRHGELAQVNTLGHQNREAGLAMQRDTIFRLASMTKPVTVVAALTLVDQGRMKLDDPIDRWLPELANRPVLDRYDGPLNATHAAPRPPNVSDLMTMRSGFASGAQGPSASPIAQAYRETINFGPFHAPTVTPDDYLRALGTLPLAFNPGTQFWYGESTNVLGALVARVSGMTFGDYLKQAIFDPLGMVDTGFWVPPEKQARLAAMYGRDQQSGARTPVDMPIPSVPLAFGAGAGGMVSTADDYLKFARMMAGHGALGDVRIMSRRLHGLMTSNWLTPAQRIGPTILRPGFFDGQGFGLNLAVIDNPPLLGALPYASVGTYGWPGAFGCSWQVDPVEDMINIFMVQNFNTVGAQGREPPLVTFTNGAYDAIDR